MIITFRTKILIAIGIFLGVAAVAIILVLHFTPRIPPDDCTEPGQIEIHPTPETSPKPYIKWAQFDVPYDILLKAYNYDTKSYGTDIHYNWIELLSYAVAKNYGNIDKKVAKNMDECVSLLKEGKTIDEITSNLKYYPFYHEVYNSILGGFLQDGALKVYSPIAKGYYFNHYEDFGNVRSYGYNRKHLGNDLLGSVGTPIIAVEDGTIEAMGWNQFGGWRVGIRSGDGRRYYYYAHLRKDHPFNNKFKVGDTVKAGEVVGYLGRSGYSAKEGVNNIDTPHLHFGLQLIFDESQKEGNNQIWVDVYNIVNLLNKNRSEVIYDEPTKEWNKK